MNIYEKNLLHAIKDRTYTRNSIASIYAVVLTKVGRGANWRELNSAILERYTLSGLIYIKAKAWKIAGDRALCKEKP